VTITKDTKMTRKPIMSMRRSYLPAAAALLAASAVSLVARASEAGNNREECVEAHGRAQDLRDRGQLSRARQTFLTCAQSSCPTLIQQDCARYSEELAQLVPTVTFGARDSNAADLPATTVYVDDVLMTSRLDDGRSYELDPGKHVVRYVHDGRETTLKVVLNQGERGRLLVATFIDRTAPKRDVIETAEPASNEPRRSALPLVLAGVGAAAAATGGVLFALGSSSVPDSCTVSSRECATSPNDPALAKAESGVRLANTGLAIGITGAVTLLGGIVWYLVQPATTPDSRRGRIGGPLFTF
jgi:hypothetical protein